MACTTTGGAFSRAFGVDFDASRLVCEPFWPSSSEATAMSSTPAVAELAAGSACAALHAGQAIARLTSSPECSPISLGGSVSDPRPDR